MNEPVASDPRIGDPILVRAAAADVTIGSAAVRLTARERELAVATAVQGHPISAVALGRLLYPDRDDDDAGNTVKAYVYRLRKRVAREFIVWRDGGYTMGPCVQVDVTYARAFVDRLPLASRAIDRGVRDAMLELARGLRADAPDVLLRREWFEAWSHRLRRLGHELAMLVGRNALEHGRVREAVRVGQELTYEDACDEEAWELLIRAHVRLGEHVGAARGFRFYEASLARELDAAPSAAIRRLLEV